MLAIPLDSRDSKNISKLYGNSPFFLLVDIDKKEFEIIENIHSRSGPKSAKFLKDKGATKTVFYHMGEGVYRVFDKERVKVFTVEHNLFTIDEIVSKVKNRKLKEVNKSNYKELLDSGSSSCSCGCEKKY